MIVRLWIPDWQLEDDRRVLTVGDRFSTWLTFDESERFDGPAERVQEIRGVARPLPTWPGAERDRHPVQIHVDGGDLYWDAPEPVEGAVEIAGSVSSNNVDAPDGFPTSSGVVRRIRMEWHELVMRPDGSGHDPHGQVSYEEVTATYFPPLERPLVNPAAEPGTIRRAVTRHVRLGRRPRRRSFTFPLSEAGDPAGRSAATAPGTTTRTRWAGALVDLDLAGSQG